MSAHPSTMGTGTLPAADWALDWAITGFVTCTIVPLVGLSIYAPTFLLLPYVSMCALLGGITGLPVGLLLWSIRQRTHERGFRAAGVTLLPIGLSLWGTAVAVVAALLVMGPNQVLLAWPMGTVAALLQTAWLVPSYPWWSRDPSRRTALRFLVLPGVSFVVGVVTPLLGIPMVGFTGAI